MSAWDDFKAGWREAGAMHRRVLPWALAATLLSLGLLALTGWKL